MDLGAFSISLSVKDLETSKSFYEKLGFEVFGGDPDHNYLIMRNGDHVIGLFQGMFEKNILTFNPGWSQKGSPSESFTDVRILQKELEDQGVELTKRIEEEGQGPESITLMDPDGNPILIDQHI
jgi:catechol 2,3-dioxygenase-like lactoylglutathione lyase family enzyme